MVANGLSTRPPLSASHPPRPCSCFTRGPRWMSKRQQTQMGLLVAVSRKYLTAVESTRGKRHAAPILFEQLPGLAMREGGGVVIDEGGTKCIPTYLHGTAKERRAGMSDRYFFLFLFSFSFLSAFPSLMLDTLTNIERGRRGGGGREKVVGEGKKRSGSRQEEATRGADEGKKGLQNPQRIGR
ncbi:hypothetical protein LY78DRAFT_490813 [Colletotrichum sublineola]|nr:hypothetical protein LY78DRAFT_490813 [Colletotrichum sublineola]